MGPTKLNMQEKSMVMALVGEGLSNREIGRKLGRSESAVRRVKKAAAMLGTAAAPERKKGTGRKRKTHPRTDKLLEREVRKDPFITAKELKEAHADVLGEVSVRTIQDRLQRHLKLPCRRAARKPLLTDKMKKQRIDFCKRYEHWTSEDWRRVVFSDESAFRTMSHRQKLVQRPLGADQFDSHYTVKTVKFPASVMVWACFSGEKGSGGLYFLDKNVNMNAALYVNVLENYMLPFYTAHENAHFLQDGAPCHRAKAVTKWLTDNKVQVILWPGHSPDLNPIENVWNEMKRKLAKLPVTSVDSLVEKIRTLWANVDPQYFKKLSDSMPKRVNAVLKVKGNMTKY